MATESTEGTGAEKMCPVCALWTACKNSEAAKHVRGIQRESLLLARSLLESCITALHNQRPGKSGG